MSDPRPAPGPAPAGAPAPAPDTPPHPERAAPGPSATPRARLGAYARWQMRDYVIERGIPTLLVYALMLLPAILSMRGLDADEVQPELLAPVLPMLAFTGVLLAINGIVATDRKQSYYRFYFAKPVRVDQFYGQAFVLHGLGFLVASALAGLGFRALTGIAFPASALGFLAIAYLVYGGLSFLLSVLVRFDWIALGVMWGLALWVQPMYPPAVYPVIGRFFDVVLPPAARMQAIAVALLSDAELPTDALAWCLAYGVVAIVAGLAALRVRTLAD